MAHATACYSPYNFSHYTLPFSLATIACEIVAIVEHCLAPLPLHCKNSRANATFYKLFVSLLSSSSSFKRRVNPATTWLTWRHHKMPQLAGDWAAFRISFKEFTLSLLVFDYCLLLSHFYKVKKFFFHISKLKILKFFVLHSEISTLLQIII